MIRGRIVFVVNNRDWQGEKNSIRQYVYYQTNTRERTRLLRSAVGKFLVDGIFSIDHVRGAVYADLIDGAEGALQRINGHLSMESDDRKTSWPKNLYLSNVFVV